ncbi:hypothetical protein O2N63_09005 [Aliiroseovarius sp. KMU-50]|uniref:Uncharacterized protein n=1 Tax=Aliiroseovarius salicola TaxID=3009082 RepID=A0ABT4W148_9RHOB|nr:hypothetical protein [Aliiroseovarius sp. KMU-50]MDA5094226.1 hypothetical protein [Aliiroseovarius sp. KMU-50]
MSDDELLDEISRLERVGLIQYDRDEEFVRIIGFHRERPAENAKHMISLIRDFKKEVFGRRKCPPMWGNAIAEFVVACVQRKQLWKPDSKSHDELDAEMKPFIRMTWEELGDPFLAALNDELCDARSVVVEDLKTTLPVLHAPIMRDCGGDYSDISDIPF